MKVAVVTRQLTNQTVVSAVITPPKDYNPQAGDFNLDSYLESEAADHIRRFKAKFVEFCTAKWECILIDTDQPV